MINDILNLSLTNTLNSIVFFVAISTLIVTLENLYTYPYFTSQGILRGAGIFHLKSRLSAIIFSDTFFLCLVISKLIACLLLIYFAFYQKPFHHLIYFMTGTYLYHLKKTVFGGDGSDQMNFLIFFVLSIAYLIDSTKAYQSAVIFIALQGILSYVVAGIAKLFGPQWRNGTALNHILRTRTYGTQWVFLFFKEHPQLAHLICLFTVIWESLFFLVLYPPFTLYLIANALIFHIFNAGIMGLNNFLWSFLATYPAILFLVQIISKGGINA